MKSVSDNPVAANIHSTCADRVSSLLLKSGWAVRLYRDPNHNGPSKCFTASDPDFTNDTFDDGSPLDNAVSSFTLFHQTSCPAVTNENWVPANQRAYLNQRSLPDGWQKCSVASMAMVLAMNSLVGSDYSPMSAKANEMFPKVLINGTAYVWKMRNELRNQGAVADYHHDSVVQGWSRIRQEVDAGRPVIVRTVHGVLTRAGHIIVAVGYRESGSSHQIIAYDPFGRWLGTCCTNNYDLNTRDANSRKGQWVSYDFDLAFGSCNGLLTGSPAASEINLAGTTATPTTRPDLVSDEPENIGTYWGVNIQGEERVFLPLVSHQW